MTYKIKFGTDGWRAIIAKEYTVDNVRRVAAATADWILSQDKDGSVVIGYDCRFAGKMFMEETSRVLCDKGVKCIVAENFVSTPMVSLAALQNGATAGIVITASHNPPAYNGFKIKASYGGPASPAEISAVEALIPDQCDEPATSYEEFKSNGQVVIVDFQQAYYKQVEENFDLPSLRDGNLQFAYDAMYGAGQDVMRDILPESVFLHCEFNPSFDGQAPEPIHKNLQELSDLISMAGDIDSGLATDGDADRVGLYNNTGVFVDSHHIILLLIEYLHKHKGMTGKVVNSFSCTSKIKKLCDLYGIEQETTKIGFKYICDIMVQEDVLIGGEESGGIAIKGHIPERDGIWMGLVMWEYMAKTGKSLDELIEGVYEKVGSFAVERYDLKINEALKLSIVENCKARSYSSFGDYQIESVDDLDGYKFHLGNEEWVMIRPSGTEPVLRVYAESKNQESCIAILEATKNAILS
jgi:phosphomannomutase